MNTDTMNTDTMNTASRKLESATIIARARVVHVWRPCPTYARIAFRGPELDTFGTPGQTFDQRIKVLFPPACGVLPELTYGDNWYTDWLGLPEVDRGAMRTYSIRDIRVDGNGTEIVIDFVLHTARGSTGPAALWASNAVPGAEVLLVGPRRGRFDGGGIEFAPGDASKVLLAGDETAAPAIARILEDAAPDLCGDAFIEMPEADEQLTINAPVGVRVHWLNRSQAAPGELLVPRVLRGLGAVPAPPRRDDLAARHAAAGRQAGRTMSEELVWETPAYSALGEPLELAPVDEVPESGEIADRYFWIAGESSVVTRLRRHLVRDLGVHRSRVAFMGYWREGVAMR